MFGSATKEAWASIAATGLICALALCGPAAAEEQMEMGVLECDLAPSPTPSVSSKSVACRFTDTIGVDSEGGIVANRVDFYRGLIDGVGLDIGPAQQQVVTWTVYAQVTTRYSQGALAGRYAGGAGDAARGQGLGANALVGGGFDGSFALQPSGIDAQTGTNIALSVNTVTLVAR